MQEISRPTLLKCRLAPTPSGFLHIGNAFSFVISWLITRRAGGHLQLRIDDGDRDRFRREYLEDIFASLAWLGLDWDSGPTSAEDFLNSFSQLGRQAEFAWVGEELKNQGQLYPCSCSRKKIKQHWVSGLHEAACSSGADFNKPGVSWRLRLPSNCIWVPEAEAEGREIEPAESMGDPVIRKKDGSWAYQVCSLAEDVLAETNFIVRGQDLLPSSALQLYLAQLLSHSRIPVVRSGAATFLKARFLHHPLLRDESGNKLSKSAGSTSLRAMRQDGGRPELVYSQVAAYLGVGSSAKYTRADWQTALLESRGLARLIPPG